MKETRENILQGYTRKVSARPRGFSRYFNFVFFVAPMVAMVIDSPALPARFNPPKYVKKKGMIILQRYLPPPTAIAGWVNADSTVSCLLD